MGVLTDDMKRVIEEQQLGFVATVTPEGLPNLSPKGALAVWDDDHIVFADIRSPTTVANLRRNPAVEINVVDALSRRGYRFRGTATVYGEGPQFAAGLEFFRRRGSTSPKRHIVLVAVSEARPLVSPAYDGGQDEAQISARWLDYWRALWRRRGVRSAARARRPAP